MCSQVKDYFAAIDRVKQNCYWNEVRVNSNTELAIWTHREYSSRSL